MAVHLHSCLSGGSGQEEPGGLQYIPKRRTRVKPLSMYMHSTLMLIFDCLFMRIMLQHFYRGNRKIHESSSMLVKIYFDSWDTGNMTSHVDFVAVLQSCCELCA